ncbi:hypothetical protein [uncultured Microbacterium sp.]|uniref:hypothetical protein n=1 Tax=uncultured Microbacterium sp. TaxID=191216 RepID=UPI0028DBC867|nr:hypothetical protein [uncultured Microbacterium sp.]
MSTSDQQGHGPLTRKQLREARQTGATPVITDEMAAAAQEPDGAAAQEPDAAVAAPESDTAAETPESDTAGTTQEPDAQPESIETEDAASPGDEESSTAASAPLTRRQAREQERIRTASVPVIDATEQEQPAVVSEVPTFAPATTGPTASGDTTDRGDDIDDDIDDDDDEQLVATPVSASDAAAASRETPVEAVIVDEPATADDDAVTEDAAPDDTADDTDDVVEVLGLEATDTDDLVDADDDEEPLADGETPVVNPAFGEAVLQQERPAFTPSFDDLIASGDSNGSHTAPSALIFTPSPGEGSLSGPVASTGEILVTGSYELPRGLGSQGHAHGVADGKEVDAVLIDGELPPASSPTPIAASSAVSTIKPAGEIIRPPAPEKGNRLMLVLAIVAGGLALALAVALGVAFTTNVF